MDYIELKHIKIFARHGCLPEESILGTHFIIDVKMGLDLKKAGQTGRIEDTVNYARVYDLIRREMQQPEKIIEAVAYRIASGIMQNFPLIEELHFRLAKQNPPLKGEIKESAIVLKMNRRDFIQK